jgi:hypothetical protein
MSGDARRGQARSGDAKTVMLAREIFHKRTGQTRVDFFFENNQTTDSSRQFCQEDALIISLFLNFSFFGGRRFFSAAHDGILSRATYPSRTVASSHERMF